MADSDAAAAGPAAGAASQSNTDEAGGDKDKGRAFTPTHTSATFLCPLWCVLLGGLPSPLRGVYVLSVD